MSTIGFTETEWNGRGKGYIETITRTDSLTRIGIVTVIVVGTEGTSHTTTTSMEGVVTTEVTTRRETVETSTVIGGEETATTFHLAMPINPRGTTQVAEEEGWRVGVAMAMGCLRGATAMVGVVSGLAVVVEGGVGDTHLLVVDTVSQ